MGAETPGVEGYDVDSGVGKESDIEPCCVPNIKLSGPSVASHFKLLENGELLHPGWWEPGAVQEGGTGISGTGEDQQRSPFCCLQACHAGSYISHVQACFIWGVL